MRTLVAGVVVIGLAIAMFLAWPWASEDESPVSESSDSTTTTKPGTTTSTVTTTSEDSHVVETVEEAEEILREFLYRWFTAIYAQDEKTLNEIVGNPHQIEAAKDQFGVMEFGAPPTRDTILVTEMQLLRSDQNCLVTWSDSGATVRGGTSRIVHTFRWEGDAWLFINTWQSPADLWEDDCVSVVQP